MAGEDTRWGNWEREHLFEKLLTPSDVGKLNRLVIPKQHAERHFPLDAESGEKGLLLNFEDEGGKSWRFRYSYWTSSQSYVLTKGWSRYVKEKQLDAGDVVLFDKRKRRRGDRSDFDGYGDGDGDRLYIGWKRREIQIPNAEHVVMWNTTLYGVDPLLQNYQHHHHHPRRLLPPSTPVAGTMRRESQFYAIEEQRGSSIHQSTTSTWKKQLRLFGVNLECEMSSATVDDPRELQLLPHS